MRRVALNGSPRGASSNSRRILAWLLEGMEREGVGPIPVVDLASRRNEALEAFLGADEVLMAFPLYTDFVPGIVAALFDSLAAADPALLRGKRVAWIVHSGFPESVQSEPLAAWLRRASVRLGLDCRGVLIKGGSEGLRVMPEGMTRKTRDAFRRAGASLARDGGFEAPAAKELATPRRFNALGRGIFRALSATGLANFYWNGMLRKNGAWERRFDSPYAPGA